MIREQRYADPSQLTQVGVVYSGTGYKVLFYEDPDCGDEVELIAFVSGQPVRSPWFDLPGRGELSDWLFHDLGVY